MIIEELAQHWVEATLITVPTVHLGYVTQFEPAKRKRHRQIIGMAVRRVLVDPVRVRLFVWSVTWDVPDPPWWRRQLSRLRRNNTTDS